MAADFLLCDSETLWTHALACTTQNYIAHANLGRYYSDRSQYDNAINEFQRELKIRPLSVEGLTNLANALARSGRYSEAIGHYLNALAIDPDDRLAQLQPRIHVGRLWAA